MLIELTWAQLNVKLKGTESWWVWLHVYDCESTREGLSVVCAAGDVGLLGDGSVLRQKQSLVQIEVFWFICASVLAGFSWVERGSSKLIHVYVMQMDWLWVVKGLEEQVECHDSAKHKGMLLQIHLRWGNESLKDRTDWGIKQQWGENLGREVMKLLLE